MKFNRYSTTILRNTAEPAAGAVPSDPPAAESADPSASPAPAPAAPSATAPDLSFISDDYRDENGNLNVDDFRTAYENMLADQAQRSEVAALVPENGEYEFTMPELDFSDIAGLPDDFALKEAFDDEAFKPLFGKAGELLQKLGAPAETSKELMGLLGQMEAMRYAKHARVAQAEAEQLGQNAAQREARLNRIQRAMESRLPEAQVKALMGATLTFEGARALETLMAPRGPGPAIPQPSGGDLEKLSPFDRLKVINAQQSKG